MPRRATTLRSPGPWRSEPGISTRGLPPRVLGSGWASISTGRSTGSRVVRRRAPRSLQSSSRRPISCSSTSPRTTWTPTGSGSSRRSSTGSRARSSSSRTTAARAEPVAREALRAVGAPPGAALRGTPAFPRPATDRRRRSARLVPLRAARPRASAGGAARGHGPNGSGKTTLVGALLGELELESGTPRSAEASSPA